MDKAKPLDKADKTAPQNNKNREKEFRGFEDLGLPEPTRYGDWDVKGRCSDF